jgi:hypothetical protein
MRAWWSACTGNGDRLVLQVQDFGQGIKPDFLPHLFDRFTRATRRATAATAAWGWACRSSSTWWNCTAEVQESPDTESGPIPIPRRTTACAASTCWWWRTIAKPPR